MSATENEYENQRLENIRANVSPDLIHFAALFKLAFVRAHSLLPPSLPSSSLPVCYRIDQQALLDTLKLGSGGASALGIQKKPAPAETKKRKSAPTEKKETTGPRRSSSRLLGLEADSEVVKRKQMVSPYLQLSLGELLRVEVEGIER